MNSSGWVAVIVVLVLIAGGAWWYTQQPAQTTNTNERGIPNETGSNVPAQGATEPKTVTINYSDSGFSPASITIAKGDTVTFTNSSSGSMWVASAQHPTHMLYAGTLLADHCPAGSALAFDQCQVGATFSFKFDKVGTWAYHNHSNASHFGKVIVVE